MTKPKPGLKSKGIVITPKNRPRDLLKLATTPIHPFHLAHAVATSRLVPAAYLVTAHPSDDPPPFNHPRPPVASSSPHPGEPPPPSTACLSRYTLFPEKPVNQAIPPTRCAVLSRTPVYRSVLAPHPPISRLFLGPVLMS